VVTYYTISICKVLSNGKKSLSVAFSVNLYDYCKTIATDGFKGGINIVIGTYKSLSVGRVYIINVYADKP